MPLPVLPDVIALGREAILAQSAITALVSTRVYRQIPASPIWPLITLSLVDDLEAPEPALSATRLQADCWGAGPSTADEQAAWLIVRTLRSVARELKGTYATGTLTACAPGPLIPSPDPQTGRIRIICDLLITAHA